MRGVPLNGRCCFKIWRFQLLRFHLAARLFASVPLLRRALTLRFQLLRFHCSLFASLPLKGGTDAAVSKRGGFNFCGFTWVMRNARFFASVPL